MAESETRIRIRHQNQILLVILICVLASLRASSQTITNGKKIHELPIKDTVKSDFLFMQGNNINGKLYKTPMSTLISAVADSVILDTTSLSNRIDLKLNKSDTVSLSNRINVKMGYSDTAGLSNRINLKENAITAGTTSQYWRGDKSWQTLTIPAQFNATAGSNMTITGTYPNLTFAASGGGGGSQTLDQTLALGNISGKGMIIGKDSASQVLIGSTAANTWYLPGGDPYPKLSIEDTSMRTSSNSPIINIASKSDGGIIWEFNPLNLDSDADVPYGFLYGIARDLQESGKDDYSYTWGTNLTSAGGRKDSGQPLFAETIETQYSISQHGWALEHYTSMVAKDGSTIRPMYQIFNRDSLYNSSTFWSSDQFRWNAGKEPSYRGSVNLNLGRIGLEGTVLEMYPASTSEYYPVRIDMYGARAYENSIRMRRPEGASGAGTMDIALRYNLEGSEPILQVGSDYKSVLIANGELRLGYGSGAAIWAPSSYRTVHIGRIGSQHNGDNVGNMQINHDSGNSFYELNTGIGTSDALRFNNTSYGRKWSIGTDASRFYINNTTDTIRVLNIDNAGSISIGNGTTIADASSIMDIGSTTKGFLPPRMTTTQKNAISSPAEGLTVYDTTLHKLCVFDGSTWQNAW
jgi:hypothetical protein